MNPRSIHWLAFSSAASKSNKLKTTVLLGCLSFFVSSMGVPAEPLRAGSARFSPLEVAEPDEVDVQKALADLPPFHKQLTLRGVIVAAALGAVFCIIT